MKKTIALLLTLIMISIPSLAYTSAEQAAAEKLYSMGLFIGTSAGSNPVFELDRPLTRQEAVVMLLRLTSHEQEALSCSFRCPFNDVSAWAQSYVGYAYITGLTQGMSESSFGGSLNITAAQYITFLLRTLGYSTPLDFQWQDAPAFAASLGLSGINDVNADFLTRGNAVLLTEKALSLNTKRGIPLLTAIKSVPSVGKGAGIYTPSFSGKGGSTGTTGKISITDQTSYRITSSSALNMSSPVKIKNNGDVQILIVHTHASECYTPNDGLLYKKAETGRTLDTQRNMLRIGEIVTDILNSRGIATVQIREIVDYPNYVNAYGRLRPTIEDYLKIYPNVQMVIDIHRDSVETSAGAPYKTSVKVNGQNAAQMMIVSGVKGNSNWQQNLGLSARLHNTLENKYNGLMRPMIVRESNYNHDLTPGSMILEIGTHGNTLSEAMYSAYLFADTLAEYLLG